MKKVLLLGDSIRESYQKEVQKLLGNGFDVHWSKENARFSAYTLNSLRFWLGETPACDIIHWNNGSWDIAQIPHEDDCFTDIDQYLNNMSRINRLLKLTGAKVILATTTPVREPITTSAIRHNEKIIEYNQRLLAYLRPQVDAVNDLYSVVIQDPETYICDDNVHLTAKGAKACAKAVATSIRSIAK